MNAAISFLMRIEPRSPKTLTVETSLTSGHSSQTSGLFERATNWFSSAIGPVVAFGSRRLQTGVKPTGIDGLKVVFFEEVRAHKGTDAAHVYGGLLATLTTFCEEQRLPYEGVPVQHIKKFITGKGNADKAAVIKAVRELGFKPKDDNEADAISLLMLKLECPEVMTLV